ncbi:hypothetical protein HZH66_011463 [Vespula vulgaris]|uniref:Uncharacterized protein n=1 Tax=Vespula vulgaris TaxID=7454 RepID=A0A834JFZ9_VESVU|nr:hypothetical protein HZH66_011463 [Vespula vulgaris]
MCQNSRNVITITITITITIIIIIIMMIVICNRRLVINEMISATSTRKENSQLGPQCQMFSYYEVIVRN